MIPNITRGGDVRGVITYLVGKGRQEEHVDPHLVAGSAEAVMLTEGRTLDNGDIAELTRLLDEPRVSSGVRVRLSVRDEHGVRHLRAAHVWHCSLSLHPSEAEQSDERWREISERFVDRMGFDSRELDDDQALRCEWVAIRHGRSAGGSDHAHIVVQLVSESGIAASTHYERLRAQQVCRELESSFGLLQVEARERAAGERGIKPGELDADRKRGRVVRDEHGNELPEQGSRRTLERIVRACATASADETEFVAALRQQRVLVHPRWAKGGQERVEGYSVALPPLEGERPVWYSGGRLSRELTLPRLRTGWNAIDESSAAAAWKPRRAITHRRSPVLRERCLAELNALSRQLSEIPAEDQAAWALVAREAAGVFSAWSLASERRPGPLAAAARSLARSSQTITPPPGRSRIDLGATRSAARLLMTSTSAGGPTYPMIKALGGLSGAIERHHRAAGQARRAAQLEASIRADLEAATASNRTGRPSSNRQPGARRDKGAYER